MREFVETMIEEETLRSKLIKKERMQVEGGKRGF